MVAISELNLPVADREALDASLWAWRAAGVDAALITWHEVLPPLRGSAGATDPYGVGGIDEPPAVPAGVEAVTVIPSLRRIECLVDDTVDYEQLRTSLAELTAAEWTACVLTALGRMAHAHSELRGSPVRVQGWWRDEQRAVHFTADQAC
jgi:hypothetical protein